jgi:lysophospholipase L1-like esterase
MRRLSTASSLFLSVLVVSMFTLSTLPAHAADDHEKWITSWTGSVHGPYPVGNPSAQPDLGLAFPDAKAGAHDQSFRMIVRPDVWGRQTRIRLSNAMGAKAVTFDGAFVGLQLSGSALIAETNRAVKFGGKPSVTVPPGKSVWSDPVALDFADPSSTRLLTGRKLAVSFHVVGDSGPMTWHAKALTSSYVTLPGAGARGDAESEIAFPFATASWYFLDAVDMMVPADTRLVVAFGDSITDGTASTLNGDDRWPDVLSRRLHAAYGEKVAVVNAGIGGNQIAGPAEYGPDKPFPGGPAASQRIDRDVLSLSGVSAIIWLEGINDFSKNGNREAEPVKATMRAVVEHIRATQPKIKIFGATVVSALGSTSAAHGFPEQDEKRKSLNAFIRTSGIFDGVFDFDTVTLDPKTGGMRPEFVPENTLGGPGDKLHPNRLGYQTMGMSVDLRTLLGK